MKPETRQPKRSLFRRQGEPAPQVPVAPVLPKTEARKVNLCARDPVTGKRLTCIESLSVPLEPMESESVKRPAPIKPSALPVVEPAKIKLEPVVKNTPESHPVVAEPVEEKDTARVNPKEQENALDDGSPDAINVAPEPVVAEIKLEEDNSLPNSLEQAEEFISELDYDLEDKPMPLDFWFKSKVSPPKWSELQEAVAIGDAPGYRYTPTTVAEQVSSVQPKIEGDTTVKDIQSDVSTSPIGSNEPANIKTKTFADYFGKADDGENYESEPIMTKKNKAEAKNPDLIFGGDLFAEKLDETELLLAEEEEKETKKKWTPAAVAIEILDWVKWALIFVLIGFLITTFVIQRNEVVGTSMLPNLRNSDQLMVEKISKLWNGYDYGDIVTLHTDGLPRGRKDLDIIKRIIGKPGDTIEITSGGVSRNGVMLNEPYLAKSILTDPMDPQYAKVKLGEDEYYVLGDNRPVSEDSRMLGPIPKKQFIGRVLIRIWPLSQFGVPD